MIAESASCRGINGFLIQLNCRAGSRCSRAATPRNKFSNLPKAERELQHWQTAVGCLMLVSDHGGDPTFPHIAMMQALHRHEPKAAPAPRRKRAKAYWIG
jgi:hypothetical protein